MLTTDIYLSIYIYKAEKLSVTPITHLELQTSSYQLPNIIKPYFKFVTTSECGDQLAFYSRLKTKKWRKLEQHSIENHSHMASNWLAFRRSRVRIQLWTDFFWKINTFAYTFFLNSALITLLFGITSTHRNGTWAKLNARLLGTRICWLLIDSCFRLFITARWRHWCRGKAVNSCG